MRVICAHSTKNSGTCVFPKTRFPAGACKDAIERLFERQDNNKMCIAHEAKAIYERVTFWYAEKGLDKSYVSQTISE